MSKFRTFQERRQIFWNIGINKDRLFLVNDFEIYISIESSSSHFLKAAAKR